MQLRLIFWLAAAVNGASFASGQIGNDPVELPAFNEILAIVDQHFADQPSLRAGDIISQNQVRSLFNALDAAGWSVEDRDDLLRRMLSSGDPLIRILRSPSGAKFMRQVASYKLIYDRLDRIAREPGGQRLLIDLVKLPDAARFAKQKTRPGVPDLKDFLPKDRSGKTRRVKDYGKATKKIYTIADFKKALQESHNAAVRKARTEPMPLANQQL